MIGWVDSDFFRTSQIDIFYDGFQEMKITRLGCCSFKLQNDDSS